MGVRRVVPSSVASRWAGLRLMTVCMGLSSLTGCAAAGFQSDSQQLEQYRKYAGAPVDHVDNLFNSGGLTPLSGHDVLFWATDNRPYLLTITGPCENLRFADALGLTHNESTDSVYARFDSLVVKGLRCTITEIRPIDYAQMKQDRRTADAEAPARRR
jgi:hypothetical protein